MDLQKTNRNQVPATLQPILQRVTVQAIIRKDFATASDLMPSSIEQTFDQPKIRELVLSIGANDVCAQVEFELIKLASVMSVGGNLNKAQVPFIADQLIQLYPLETIADFKICFQRGAIGQYGQIQRMDGITIREWMEKYLEEKYKILEDHLMKEKENLYKIQEPNENIDWLEVWKKEIENSPGPNNLSQNLDRLSKVRSLTSQEIMDEGRAQPKPKGDFKIENYMPPTKEWFEMRADKIKVLAEKYYREKHPHADDEEVKQYLDSL